MMSTQENFTKKLSLRKLRIHNRCCRVCGDGTDRDLVDKVVSEIVLCNLLRTGAEAKVVSETVLRSILGSTPVSDVALSEGGCVDVAGMEGVVVTTVSGFSSETAVGSEAATEVCNSTSLAPAPTYKAFSSSAILLS